MRVLAIDTSSRLASAAVLDDGSVVAERARRPRRHHADDLLPMIMQMLRDADIAIGEVDLFGVGTGPGSFTGTRVGVATMKGLCLALDRPLLGVGSLAALARGAASSGSVGVFVDAHRERVFAASYEVGPASARLIRGPIDAVPAEARDALGRVSVVCGDGIRRYASLGDGVDVAPPACDAIRATWVAVLAAELHARGAPTELAMLEPLYVRPTDAQTLKAR